MKVQRCQRLWQWLLLLASAQAACATTGWSGWSGWSSCSRSCGTGLSTRTRSCDGLNRTSQQKRCPGEDTQRKICNTQSCPAGSLDTSERKCSAYNHKLISGKRYKWEPYYKGSRQCEVVCRTTTHNVYVAAGELEDGAVCGDSRTPGICIGGRCQPVGCDDVVGSGKVRDKCGVCAGDNSTCHIISGIFTRAALPYGYNRVTTLPAGACNVNITQLRASKNSLALKYTNGKYIVNGNWALGYSHDYPAAGTVFKYSRGTGASTRGIHTESILADGPTNTSLDIMLIKQSDNRGIMYTYTIPMAPSSSSSSAPSRRRRLHHKQKPVLLHDEASALTAAGKEQPQGDEGGAQSYLAERRRQDAEARRLRAERQQRRREAARRRQEQEEENKAQAALRLSQQQQKLREQHEARRNYQRLTGFPATSNTNAQPAPAGGYTAGRRVVSLYKPGAYEAAAGRGTTALRQPAPGNTLANGQPARGYPHIALPPNQPAIPLRQPAQPNNQPAIALRQPSQPVQTIRQPVQPLRQPVNIGLHQPSQGNTLLQTPRRNPLLPQRQSYPLQPGYQQPASLRPASSGLLQPSQHQPMYPQYQGGGGGAGGGGAYYPYPGPALNDQVAGLGGGRQAVRLGLMDAGNADYAWKISGFTDCSASCGGGEQSTQVVCVKANSQAVVTDENCSNALKPQPQKVACNNVPCPPAWGADPWSACSTSCDRGTQSRRLACRQRLSATVTVDVAPSQCRAAQRPADSQSCNHDKPCIRWKVGEWGRCSVECGRGQRSREVVCVNADGRAIAENKCSGAKPTAAEICDMGSCAETWFFTAWSQQCSAECGSGVYSRRVHCSAAEERCTRLEKPAETSHCRSDVPCGGKWFTGPWSQCNVTCGSGAMTRDVVCMKKLGRLLAVVAEDNCRLGEKPHVQQACDREPCPAQWYMTEWSECSRTCGTGVSTRGVKCLDPQQQPSTACDVEHKPELRQTCNTYQCPAAGPGARQQKHAPRCQDKFKNCRLVVQARLCRYDYYKNICCFSCSTRQHHGTHRERKET